MSDKRNLLNKTVGGKEVGHGDSANKAISLDSVRSRGWLTSPPGPGVLLLLAVVLSMALPSQAAPKAKKDANPSPQAEPAGNLPAQLDQPTKTPPPIATTVASNYLVKVSRFTVSGGDKPGDTATLSMLIETSGNAIRDIPWMFSNGATVIANGIERGVPSGKTIEVTATYRVPTSEGVIRLQGTLDPKNTLGEADGERANNLSQIVEKTLRNALPAAVGASKLPGGTVSSAPAKNEGPGIFVVKPVAVQPGGVQAVPIQPPAALANPGKLAGIGGIANPPARNDRPVIVAVDGPPGLTDVRKAGPAEIKADLKPNAVKALLLDPNVFRAGSIQGTVTLDARAPVTGQIVSLASSSPSLSVPQSVTVAAGSSTAVFAAAATLTGQPGNVTVSATIAGSGAVAKQATVTVWGAEQVQSLEKVGGVCPRNSVDDPNRNLRAGDRCLLRVYLAGPAGQGGAKAILGSSSPALTLPADVSFAALAGYAQFDVVVSPNATPGPITITATGDRPGGVPKQITLTIDPAVASKVIGLGLPEVAEARVELAGLVELDRGADPGGVMVVLSSSSPSVTVPKSVSIAAGVRSAPFTVRVSPRLASENVVITGTRSGSGSTPFTQTLKIKSVQVASLSSLSELGSRPLFAMTGVPLLAGVSTQIKVSLDGVANSNVTVNLSSSNPAVIVPASVTIPAGQTAATFSATSAAGANEGDATISAVRTGNASIVKQLVVTLVPIQPKSLSLSSSYLTWSPAAPVLTQATLTLTAPAPAGGLAVGIECGVWPSYGPVMDCQRDNSVTLPGSIVVPAGQTTATFTVTLGTQRPPARQANTWSTVMFHAFLPGAVDRFASRPGMTITWP
jgi:hypothetical protein